MGLKEDFEEYKKMIDIQLSDEQARVIAEAAREKGKLLLTLPSRTGFYEVYRYEDFLVQIHNDGHIASIIKNNKTIYMDKHTRFGTKLIEKYFETRK